MREILFRGKDIAGNWHYGVPLVFTEDYVCMTAPHTYNKAVISETVGQYTGLTDKNGKKIFEGDIVSHTQRYALSGNVISIGIVKWSDSYGGWLVADFSNGRADMFLANEARNTARIEKISTIYDNPELLKGGAE